MTKPSHPFLSQAARLFNSGQTRVVVLSGNIHDIFAAEDDRYLPLPDLIAETWDLQGRMVLTYELNGPIRFRSDRDRQLLKDAWTTWRTGMDSGNLALAQIATSGNRSDLGPTFDEHLASAVGRPTVALELLRQCCLCSRANKLRRDLVIIVEAADLILPDAPIPQLGDADRQRVHICHDWFADPGFLGGGDVVLMLAESRSLLNQRIARLPPVLEVAIPAPDHATRQAYIEHLADADEAAPTHLPEGEDQPEAPECSVASNLAERTAGLTLHALRQLWVDAVHRGGAPDTELIVKKVASFVQGQLGEDGVRFARPQHRLDDLVGNRRLKDFLRGELIPRLQPGPGALPGAAVAGPIGAGKTFIFEAVAAELGMPVLELKNLRSQWFGQTDVILERLRRVLEGLDRVLIIVDEADTQFGGLGANEHSTERRLTGKVQAMMSDPQLLGRVFWLLMTARIHRLSPDLRRPGRVGDLIIPVLDPDTDEDRHDFLAWAVKPALGVIEDPDTLAPIAEVTRDYSAAAYAALRRELAAQASQQDLDVAAVTATVRDMLPPAIASTRRYQTLQALVNCTRRRLLPDPNVDEMTRESWQAELSRLEARGIE